MKRNDFTVTNPALPPEDKPNTRLIKMLIILAIIGGIAWFIYKRSQDGSLDNFIDAINASLEEDDSELTEDDIDEIEDYLSERYNDNCKYSKSASSAIPRDAKGGLFECSMINDADVLAYITDDDVKDSYTYSKYYGFTKKAAMSVVKLYFPEADVELVNSIHEISSDFDANIAFNEFVKRNGFEYVFRVELPSGTGININNLTALSRQLSAILPNYQLDGVYLPGVDDDPTSTSGHEHVFTIRSKDGKGSVQVNQ